MLSRNPGPDGMRLVDLDATTRLFMMVEFEADLKSGKLYVSNRLTPAGKTAYSVMLREGIDQHGIEWLVNALIPPSSLSVHARRGNRGGNVADLPKITGSGLVIRRS